MLQANERKTKVIKIGTQEKQEDYVAILNYKLTKTDLSTSE